LGQTESRQKLLRGLWEAQPRLSLFKMSCASQGTAEIANENAEIKNIKAAGAIRRQMIICATDIAQCRVSLAGNKSADKICVSLATFSLENFSAVQTKAVSFSCHQTSGHCP
jgi:hypothetical protein